MPRSDRQASPPAPADVATRLHSAAIHLLRRLRAADTATGLSGPRLSALSVIVFGGPVTLGELARAEQVRPPTMSRLVTGLARDGLIERRRDPADGRVQRIRATPRGRALLEAGRTRRVRLLTAELERLTRRDYAAIVSALPILESVAQPDAPPRRR